MTKTIVDKQYALEKFELLENKTLNKVWRGYGTTIFFEFGIVDDQGKGEITLAIDKGWEISNNKLNLNDQAYSDLSRIDNIIENISNVLLKKISFVNDKIICVFDETKLTINLNSEKSGYINFFKESEYLIFGKKGFVIEKGD